MKKALAALCVLSVLAVISVTRPSWVGAQITPPPNSGPAGPAGPTGPTGPTGPVGSLSFGNSFTGTTQNKIVKITSNPSVVLNVTTGDTGGAVGICDSGCGMTGTATIISQGLENCVFDGATTAGDYVQISSMTAGDCADAGATYPAAGTGQVIGRVLSTHAGAGTFSIDLFPSEIKGPATTLCSGTITPSGTVNTATQSSVGTATCTGLAATDTVMCTPNVNIFGVTGFVPATTGILTLSCAPSTNTITVYAENNTSGNLTLGSIGINYRVVR